MFRKFQISNCLPNRYFSENCRWVPLTRVYGGMVNKCTRENVKHVYVHGCLTGVFWAMLKTCMWGNV